VIADRAGLSVGPFGADQTGDEGIEFIAPGQALAGKLQAFISTTSMPTMDG
jgi:hypothetical protein